jgi:hypothetical protein
MIHIRFLLLLLILLLGFRRSWSQSEETLPIDFLLLAPLFPSVNGEWRGGIMSMLARSSMIVLENLSESHQNYKSSKMGGV